MSTARRLGGRDHGRRGLLLSSPRGHRPSSPSRLTVSNPSEPVSAGATRRFSVGALVVALVVASGLWVLTQQPSASAGTVSLLPDKAVPRTLHHRAARPLELGMRFRTTAPSEAVAVQLYQAPRLAAARTATLWSPTGRALARVTFADRGSSGLRTARFAEPVRLLPGRTYVVSYTAPTGRFSVDRRYFTQRISRGPLVAPRLAGVVSRRPGTFPKRTTTSSSYAVDIVVRRHRHPSPPPGGPTSPTPTTGPTTTPTTTPTTRPASGFPNASNTGVPAGVALTPYAGPCRVTTAGTVIDGKTVNCHLTIAANNVTIRNSVVNGTVTTSGGTGLLVADSEVRIGDRAGTGIGNSGFTVERVEVTGGNRSINCELNCTVRDSYVHGQFTDETGVFHESGIRMGAGSTIVHNTIACDAPDVPPDAGCSAGLTGYGDFAAVENNLIQDNLFKASTGGTCAYGGSSRGKPYTNGARNIRFINNVFERGTTGYCGKWAPIMDFNRSAPGNVWSGNVWANGGAVSAG